MTVSTSGPTGFATLGLPEPILKAVAILGFNEPTPIQAQAIPALLSGQDVLGQAQTGTGKTAAFALPLLANIQVKRRAPQILVLTPTRELALQVAEAFNSFATNLPGITILPVYGGQGYSTQLNMLRKGVHIIIGTPGRVMDHMRNEALDLEHVKTVILDEADEMLRMGFAEDVEWILEQIPGKRQFGLFSATMPPQIKAIAEKYLDNPQRITVKTKTTTAATIRQCYLMVSGPQKLDALCRVIETEDSDGMIVFVKTKRATEEVAEELAVRGFNAVAINGDIVQKQRERVIDQLKAGRIKVLIATDVAARGIDVDRITHVINYDAPNNPESYVHRIGRTGRAGRNGTAILFVSPRERYLLRNIERETKQPIEELATPSIKNINARRIEAFKQRITEAMAQDTSVYQKLLNEYVSETNTPALDVAAALAKMLQGNKEFLLTKNISTEFKDAGRERGRSDSGREHSRGFDSERRRGSDNERRRGSDNERHSNDDSFERKRGFGSERGRKAFDSGRASPSRERTSNSRGFKEQDMEQYRVDIGREDGLQPKNLVGAIANTAGIEGRMIGKIKIESKFTLVDLPKDMPKNVLQTLQRLKLGGKQMNLKKIR